MKSSVLFVLLYALFSFSLHAQERDETITEAVDRLTQKWDKEAEVLQTYNGMREYCKNRQHRANTIDLVREIHHYDSVLYQTVKQKFDQNKDPEAEATLKDIKRLEEEYSTKGFLEFLHRECGTFNEIENNYGRSRGKKYDKEVAKMEKELSKYVSQITLQIDNIDEHVHHLEGL